MENQKKLSVLKKKEIIEMYAGAERYDFYDLYDELDAILMHYHGSNPPGNTILEGIPDSQIPSLHMKFIDYYKDFFESHPGEIFDCPSSCFKILNKYLEFTDYNNLKELTTMLKQLGWKHFRGETSDECWRKGIFILQLHW